MSTIDTISLRWQRDLPEQKNIRDSGFQPIFNVRFGHIEKWTHNVKNSNLPRLTWSHPSDRAGWLTAEFSPPYLVHGTNAVDADDANIAAALDLVSEYVSAKTGIDCDARKALVGRVDYAANFSVGQENIPLYLDAALNAKITRLKPPRRESETAVCVEGSARKIQLYDKHADVLNKVESGRLSGDAAKLALESSFGILRVESRFKTTKWVTRLAKTLDVERTPPSLLNCQTADKVIAMELEKLSLDKPVEPETARLDALIETFGCKKGADLFGFLALHDRFGDNFYRFVNDISKATYERKVKELKDAGLWLSTASESPLAALSEVEQAGHRKAA